MFRWKFSLFFLFIASLGFSQDSNVYNATIDADGVQRVEILGGEYFFNPDDISVKVNVPIELIVKKSRGITPHNIVMRYPEAGMNFRVNLGRRPKIIRFTPTKVGRYPFWCDKKFLFSKSHREKGMKGVLEVTD